MNYDKAERVARKAYKDVPLYINRSRDNKEEITIHNIPIIKKENLIDRQDECLEPAAYMDYMQNKLICLRTSGSTGHYLQIMWKMSDYQHSMAELWLRRIKYYGIRPDSRLACFFTDNRFEEDKNYVRKNNELAISKLLILPETIDEAYRMVMDWNPEWMILQPSTAAVLVEYIKRTGAGTPDALKYIEFTGEILTDDLREAVQDVFNCRTADQYGANEVNSIAYECPCGNKHIILLNTTLQSPSIPSKMLSRKKSLSLSIAMTALPKSKHPKKVRSLRCIWKRRAAMKMPRKPSEISLCAMRTALPKPRICLTANIPLSRPRAGRARNCLRRLRYSSARTDGCTVSSSITQPLRHSLKLLKRTPKRVKLSLPLALALRCVTPARANISCSIYADKLFLPLYGRLMEVSKEDYTEFYRAKRRQKYLDERSADNGDFSYDMLTTDEFSGEDILIAEQPDVCDTVVESIMTDKLRKAILKLTDEEQLLIYRHYYAGISGTDLAEIYGVSQQAISKRIAKIRAKLKNLLEN